MAVSDAPVEGLLEAFFATLGLTNNLLGIGLVVFILLQVGIVLCGLYLRPVRSWRQAVKWLLTLFAAVAFCCMTVWLLWELAVA